MDLLGHFGSRSPVTGNLANVEGMRTYRLWRGEGSHDAAPLSGDTAGRWFSSDRLTAHGYAQQNKGHLHYLDLPSQEAARHVHRWDLMRKSVEQGIASAVLVSPEMAARKVHARHCPGCKTDSVACPGCGTKVPGGQEFCPRGCGQVSRPEGRHTAVLDHFEASDQDGPWYHGTTDEYAPGDQIEHHYWKKYPDRPDFREHSPLYTTSDPALAGHIADLRERQSGGRRAGRMYEVRPTGPLRPDETANPIIHGATSRQASDPLHVVREVPRSEWPADLMSWRKPLPHEAAIRPGRGQESCSCCSGQGEHSDGSRCERCQGSGFTGKGDRAPSCPGQKQPRRRHWRQGSRMNQEPVTLWRGEGTHDDPSPYAQTSRPEIAGQFYTDDPEKAAGYARARRQGHVYRLEAQPGEADGPYASGYLVRDPEVRARRVHDQDHCPGCMQRQGVLEHFEAAFEDASEESQESRRARVQGWIDRNTKADGTVAIPRHWGPQVEPHEIPRLEHHGWPADLDRHEDHWHHLTPETVSLKQPIHIHQPWVNASGAHEKIEIGRDEHELGRPYDEEPARFLRHQGKTYLIDGHHRYAEARLTGKSSMPGVVADTARESDLPRNCPDCRELYGEEEPMSHEAAGGHLDNPHDGGHEWFHGTQAPEHELHSGFENPAEHSPEAYEAPDEQQSGTWDSLLGTHFAAHRGLAAQFAAGEHSSGASDRGPDASPAVVHARLRIRNPKHYASEHDMASEVYEHEHRSNPISAQLEGDDEYDSETWPAAHHLTRTYGESEIPRGVSTGAPRGLGFTSNHPDRTEWVNGHRDRYDMAMRFKERLRAQGHDGITYGNEYEKTGEGGTADRAAIAFHPHQIEVTGHHRIASLAPVVAHFEPVEAAGDHLDLYHHTTPENAAAIRGERRMIDLHGKQGPVYFSDAEHGFYGGDYGPEAVHVRVPRHLATENDSFGGGAEKFYTVNASDLRPEHFIGRTAAVVAHFEAEGGRWGPGRAHWSQPPEQRTGQPGEVMYRRQAPQFREHALKHGLEPRPSAGMLPGDPERAVYMTTDDHVFHAQPEHGHPSTDEWRRAHMGENGDMLRIDVSGLPLTEDRTYTEPGVSKRSWMATEHIHPDRISIHEPGSVHGATYADGTTWRPGEHTAVVAHFEGESPGPLYHGSMKEIAKGTVLTPESRDAAGSSFSGDYVYATTNPEAARYFASMHDTSPLSDQDVHIHRVEPVGAVEPDDFPAGAEDERFAHGNYRAKALRVTDHYKTRGHWAAPDRSGHEAAAELPGVVAHFGGGDLAGHLESHHDWIVQPGHDLAHEHAWDHAEGSPAVEHEHGPGEAEHPLAHTEPPAHSEVMRSMPEGRARQMPLSEVLDLKPGDYPEHATVRDALPGIGRKAGEEWADGGEGMRAAVSRGSHPGGPVVVNSGQLEDGHRRVWMAHQLEPHKDAACPDCGSRRFRPPGPHDRGEGGGASPAVCQHCYGMFDASEGEHDRKLRRDLDALDRGKQGLPARGPYFHGTSDDGDPEEITPQGAGRRHFPHDHEGTHAYATADLGSAWDYAERAAEEHGGRPRVFEVAPHADDVEKDPTHDPGGYSRRVNAGDVRSRAGFAVHREMPVPEHIESRYDDEDEDWGGHEGALEQPGHPSFVHEYETYGSGPEGGYVRKSQVVTGPFYHGGRANLAPGGEIRPGRKTNSWGDEGPRSKHVYFSTERDTAASYAEQTKGHLYEVRPTGEVHFDGSGGAGSYKTKHPLEVIRKVPPEEWKRTAARLPDPAPPMLPAEIVRELPRAVASCVPQSAEEAGAMLNDVPEFLRHVAAGLEALRGNIAQLPVGEDLGEMVGRMASRTRQAADEAESTLGSPEGTWKQEPQRALPAPS